MDVRILGASIVVCQIYLCCYRNLPDKYTFPFFRNFRIGSCLFHSVLVFGWHVGCDWVCTPSWNTIYNGDLKMFLLFKGVIFRFQPLIVVPICFAWFWSPDRSKPLRQVSLHKSRWNFATKAWHQKRRNQLAVERRDAAATGRFSNDCVETFSDRICF